MPRFYFHLRDDAGLMRDTEGSELPDLDAARAEAVADARSLVAEWLRMGQVVDGRRFEIADEAGQVLAVIPLRDVLKLPEE